MINIIAVDDEALALKRFKHIVSKDSRVNLLDTFTNPELVVDYIKSNHIDIAFLDIEMPGISGLSLAELIQEANPYVQIIFVTAFDQYALDAFKAHAMGYLLKPLDFDEFVKHIDIFERNHAPRNVSLDVSFAVPDYMLSVNCFGQFSCIVNSTGEAISFRTAKTAELFAFLIHHYDAAVAKYAILDALFPDMDYEKSNKLFYVSCSYLRSAFTKAGITDILLRENDNYRINTKIIDCDYIKFMQASSHIKELSKEKLTEISLCYKGEYLMGKSYEWAFEMKPYTANLYQTLQFTLTKKLIDSGNRIEAYHTLERIMVNDPYNEEPVALIMQMYVEDGQKDKAITVYKLFESKLEDQLDIIPSSRLRAIIR